ncbi:MAG: 2Og-Fe(II) oxygenase [Satyrvirus sp.]|uniref:2Og-Fe(II) oxygenase n=1 Tax=Satyrvirus sp. TaxID=2487771 RepID=A0A3G5AE38_9VIRU|nr:MAG: 2Og-Fe(II) oxygenase [Satyrvirus sp.]
MYLSKEALDVINSLENDDFEILQSKHKKYSEEYNKKLKFIYNFSQNSENVVDGLYYIPNYLTNDEIMLVKEKIKNEIKFSPISNSYNSRKVAHFGYYYSYNRSGLKEAPAIPIYLFDLVSPGRINSSLKENIISTNFDQLIINEYKPGQKIAYHIDHVSQFGPIIACISVGSEIYMNFKYQDIEKKIKIEEGSLYIMSGDARYKWMHSLTNSTNDNRYSLTFRTVLSK